ncbi:heterokaryon incompatibility protein-domain-containing protein [Hypoxylon fuscum]|nr:heterokaryon incompatibility protein-domain-containing protein [Hypoxylon fuscum]
MLCAVCMSMFLGPWRGNHHKTVKNVENAANNGCYICLYLLFEFHEKNPVFVEGPSDQIIYEFDPWIVHIYTPLLSLEVRYELLRGRYADTSYWQYIENVNQDRLKDPSKVRDNGLVGSGTTVSNTGDSIALEYAKALWQNCLKDHNECREMSSCLSPAQGGVSEQSWQPKRLIDCSFLDGQLHLIHRDSKQIHEAFATLSYCWGIDPSFYNLTSKNEQEALNGETPLSNLPQTFRDAIRVCRKLHITYLWIDSICILQSGDDGEDWELHVREMCRIYSSCILNIAAEHTSSPSEGLFMDRHPAIFQPTVVAPSSEEVERIMARQSLDSDTNSNITHTPDTRNQVYQLNIVNPRDLEKEIKYTKLSSRGWVMQERLLSSRTLHFTQRRIVWSCYYGNSGEGSKDNEYSGERFSSRVLDDLNPSSFEPNFARLWWHERIIDYSKRRLSFPEKDKLVAIAGIARAFNCKRGDEYLAGIFRRDLPWDLLWKVRVENCQTMTEKSHQSPDRVPSWSWASIHGPIDSRVFPSFLNATIESLVHIKSIDIVLSDVSNPYGRVKGGAIVFQGFLGTKADFKPEYYKCLFDGRHDISKVIWSIPLIHLADGKHKSIIGTVEGEDESTYGLLVQTDNPVCGYYRVGIFQSKEGDLARRILDDKVVRQTIKLI